MRANEFINEVKIDNKNGWGSVPFNADIDYFGLRVLMKPSIFLKLAAPILEPTSKKDIKNHLSTGGSIGAPFLNIKIPQEWDSGDFSKPAAVRNHEGRNRMLAILELEGDNPVEVHLIPTGGLRHRDMTPSVIKSLNSILYPEGLSFKTIRGPYFSVVGALDEDWKQKAAAGALGAALALGTTNLRQNPEFIPEPVKQVQKAVAKVIPNKDYLAGFLEQAGITGTELVAFMSQAAHETQNFTHMVEIGTEAGIAKKYDPKFNPRKAKILGNTQIGDGFKYRGRGFLHLTGRDNYSRAGKALGLPLEENPDMVLQQDVGAKVALWYWNNRVKNKIKDFGNVAQVTKKINPGMKGLKSRVQQFAKYTNPNKNQNNNK